MNRRGFLAAAGASLSLGAGAGCTAPTEPSDPALTLPDATWPMHAFDPGNTGYNPEATGPTDAGVRSRVQITGKWTLPAPSVARGTLLVGSRPFLYAWRVGGAFRWRTHVDTHTHHFTPAVDDGLAFFASKRAIAESAPGDGFIYAVDAVTGSLEWRAPAAVTGAPVPLGDRLYHTAWPDAGGQGYVRARSTAGGEVLWTAPVAEQAPAPARSAVAAADGTIFATAEFGPDGNRRGRILALDAATGAERWRVDVPSPVRADPVVADGRVYAGTLSGDFYARDAATGAERWRARAPNPVRQRPAVADGVVYVLTTPKDEDITNVVALDAAGGTERWRNTVPSAPNGIAVAGDRIYVGGFQTIALDASDGSEIWSIPITHRRGKGGSFGPPTVVGDALLTGACIKHEDTGYTYDNYLYAFR